jgi:LPS O-antigen subunit length determinant protein (WzzB/FepE family)
MNLEKKELLSDEEINLNEVAKVLWKEKYKIFIFSFVFCIFGLLISFSISDIYKSEAILASSDQSNLNNLLDRYSGIASLTGLNISGSGEIDKVEMGIEIMSSLDFFEKFSASKDILFLVAAVKGWDSKNDTFQIDQEVYDFKTKEWNSSGKFSINGKPSLQDVHSKFIDNLDIEKDLDSGFLKISYKHVSPKAAKDILEELILQINELIRQKDISEAENSIKFLQEEMIKNKFIGVQSAMSNLIQSQMETIMVANASSEYLFKILSSPFVPERKDSPNRLLIVILTFLIGFFLSLIYFFYLKFLRESLND